MVNALSFDVEEWYHRNDLDIHAMRVDGNRERVVRDVDRILELLRTYKVRATFFVVGSLAEDYPLMIHRICEEGHEVASHGYSHKLVYEQGKDEFRADIKKSISVLENLTGRKVLGYRAPSFSITRESLWALHILKEEGILYDSSIFPVKTSLYGIAGAGDYPSELIKGLFEFPASLGKFFGRRVPFGAGIFFRLMPFTLIRSFGRGINLDRKAFILNIHTWETESFKERFSIACRQSLAYQLKITFLGYTERKLKMILPLFPFAPVGEAIGILK